MRSLVYKGKLRTVRIFGPVFLRIIQYRDRLRRRHTETTMEPDIELHYVVPAGALPTEMDSVRSRFAVDGGSRPVVDIGVITT